MSSRSGGSCVSQSRVPASKQARLTRLAPGSKFGSEETLVPLKAPPEHVADALIALLRELVPPEAAAPEERSDVPVESEAS